MRHLSKMHGLIVCWSSISRIIFLSIYIAKLRPKTDKHDFIFTSSQQSAKPLSYTSVHSIFSKIDQVFTNQYPEYKSPLYSDSLQRLTPHTTRHTWAFLTLQKIWHLKYLKSQQNKTHFIAEVPSLSGIMEEAKDELRLMGDGVRQVKCLIYMQNVSCLSRLMLPMSNELFKTMQRYIIR